MPIIFDNERKKYIPKQRLQDDIKYGTGCHLGGAIYLPSKPYYDGSAFSLSPISLVKNIIETGKLIKDIVSGDTMANLTAELNSRLPPKNGNGFIFLSKNK